MPHKSPLPTELLLLLLLSTLWGASYSFIKLAVATIPPLTLIAARTLIAGALLAVIIRSRRLVWPSDRMTWRRFLIQAGLNSVVPFTLIAWAEQVTDAGLATILNSTSPIFTFILTALVTHHEPITSRKLFGIVAGLLGTCLVVGPQALLGLGDALVAQLAIVAATICYAGAAIVGRGFKGLDPMLPAAGSLLSGAALLVPVALVVDRPWTLTPSGRFAGSIAGTCDDIDGACDGDLFPAGADTRLPRGDRAILSACPDQRRHRRASARRTALVHRLGRTCLRRRRRHRDDAPHANAPRHHGSASNLIRQTRPSSR